MVCDVIGHWRPLSRNKVSYAAEDRSGCCANLHKLELCIHLVKQIGNLEKTSASCAVAQGEENPTPFPNLYCRALEIEKRPDLAQGEVNLYPFLNLYCRALETEKRHRILYVLCVSEKQT